MAAPQALFSGLQDECRGTGCLRLQFDRAFEYGDLRAGFLPQDAETGTKGVHAAMNGVDDEGAGQPMGVVCGLNQYLAAMQADAALLRVVIDIHGAGGVEPDAAAVGKCDGAPFAGSGLVAGVPFGPGRLAGERPAQRAGAAEQKQHLGGTSARELPFRRSVERAAGTGPVGRGEMAEGAADALDLLPCGAVPDIGIAPRACHACRWAGSTEAAPRIANHSSACCSTWKSGVSGVLPPWPLAGLTAPVPIAGSGAWPGPCTS